MIEKLIDIQRNFRAKLSFFYNENEKNNRKDKKLNEFLILEAKKINKKERRNYKKTHKIFSQRVLDLILEGKLLNFLQVSFIQKMFFVHNRLFLAKYLSEMKLSKNWSFWKKLIKETKVGNPVRFFLYQPSSGNKIFQTYHLKKFNEYENVELNNFEVIFEFGGGYGNLAYTFKKINKNSKFIIFDTNEVNLLQFYYLKKNNLNVNFKNYNSKTDIILINSLREFKKQLLIFKNKKKLFVANWSLSETPLSFRRKIQSLIDKFDFQLISFQHKFEDIDNIKYFKKLNYLNKNKNRNSKIIQIPHLKNNYYLFSKK